MLTHQRIPLLLAKSALSCWMYPTVQKLKPLFLQHLAIPGFPQSDHTVSKLSAVTGSLWNIVKQASRPQNSASHLLGLQGSQQTPAFKISYPQLILIRSRLWQANRHITSKCLTRISMTFCKLLYPLPRNNSIMQEIAIEVCNKENKSCPNDVLIRLNTCNNGVLGLNLSLNIFANLP